MFKSQTLIKQQQVIENLTQENDTLKHEVQRLQRECDSLNEAFLQEKEEKESVLDLKNSEVRAYENALNEHKSEKSLLQETKTAIEKRYKKLRDVLSRIRDSFKNQRDVTSELDEVEFSGVAQEFDTLLEQAREFQQSVEMIKKISNELELLGVNATIQAAHAGEKGKGFLIVAEEINKLSNHSKRSVEEALRQLKLFTEITRGLTQDFTKTVSYIESNMEAFEELGTLMEEQFSIVNKEDRETRDRM